MIESLSHFFGDTTAGATDAIWSQTGEAVRVIFDNGFSNILGVDSRQPRAIVMDTAIPGITRNDYLTIAGIVYAVTEIEPDGTGVTTLRLEINRV